MNSEFKGKTLLITGGTGSFGSTVLKRLLEEPFDNIRIFSRDEKKQEDQRHKFNDPRITFHIGDVRDFRSTIIVTRGVDFIFHAAALKQVPSCEFHPMEAVKTNVLGTSNLIEAALENGVSRVVCLSTDKAVYPINAMGISKAMMEKVVTARARAARGGATTITTTRYGNVLASRGSVIPLFVRQALSGAELTITDPKMTRFVMTLQESVDLVLHAFKHGESGDLFVQKAPAVTVLDLTRALLEVLGRPDHPIKIMGTRHGEKLYEALLSREEMAVAQDQGRYYRVPPDDRDLNYSVYEDSGEKRLSEGEDYNSHNTERLDVAGMMDILLNLDYMKRVLSGEMSDGDA
jgi:UDP-N-acetylglucosamine 4,6-dehydratase